MKMDKSFVKTNCTRKSRRNLMSLLKSSIKCWATSSYSCVFFLHLIRFHIVFGKTAKCVFQLLITYLQVLPLQPNPVRIPLSLSPPRPRLSTSPSSSVRTLPSTSPLSTPSTTSPSSSFQNIQSDDSTSVSMAKHSLEDTNEDDVMDTSEDPLANLPTRQRRNKKAKDQSILDPKGKAKGNSLLIFILHICSSVSSLTYGETLCSFSSYLLICFSHLEMYFYFLHFFLRVLITLTSHKNLFIYLFYLQHARCTQDSA